MVKISMSSWSLKELNRTSPEKFQKLRQLDARIPPFEYHEDGKEKYYGHDFESYVNDPEMLPDWLIELVDVKIPRVMRLNVEGKIGELQACELFSRMQVHLPGVSLLTIDEVKIETDCCTESLQILLNDGWRIIACLPITGQRRPDYVLGKGAFVGQMKEMAEKRLVNRPISNLDESVLIPF